MLDARFLLLLLLVPGLSLALDIENAKRINRSCALCHGIYGQGTPGTKSPRLAGMPASYLEKEMKYYRDGTRTFVPMVVASSVKGMSDEDIADIAEYLSGIDLHNLSLPKIPVYPRGDPEKGKEIYKEECDSCHRNSGMGKPDKGIPPLAGQYGSYLFSQLTKFQGRKRFHDDDPDDDVFEDWNLDEFDDLVAYVTKFPPNGTRGAAAGDESGAMAGMVSMQGMAAIIKASNPETEKIPSPEDIAGRFRITPTGEILLNPVNQDLRAVAGLSGDFKITSGGIVFLPR